jgi:NAD(P)-dependent dehydrogenase (short-subunit alcohol dehydrogenase family)
MNTMTHYTRAARGIRLLLATIALAFASLAGAETVLITGANSGIGLEFAKQYADKNWTVIATHRHDTPPDSLAQLAAKHPNVHVEKMDVASKDSVFALAKKLQDQPIDVLINNAGIFCLCDWMDPNDTSQRFGTLRYEDFEPVFETNVRGVIMVSEAFIANVKASQQKKIITISSTVGTISKPGNRAFWYGASKAAVNKINVNLAEVLRSSNVIVVPMHPGAVHVEKQATKKGAHFIETDYSIRQMIATIGKLKMSDSGKFLNYDGTELPW